MLKGNHSADFGGGGDPFEVFVATHTGLNSEILKDVDADKNYQVSVIIPIYNSEKYLWECLDCVVNQTLKNIEIILVNDGSTDGSDEICKSYANKDNRIKYFYIEHGGVSVARNFGIDRAVGEFIYFVDSDDTINPSFLETSYFTGQANDSDVVFVAGKAVEHDSPEKIFSSLPAWGAFYRKSFLDEHTDIKYPENMSSSEDGVFSFKLLMLTDKKSVNKFSFYNYRQHNDMATVNASLDTIYKNIILCIEDVKSFLKEHDFPSVTKAWALGAFINYDFFSNKFYKVGLRHFLYKKKVYDFLKNVYKTDVAPYIKDEDLRGYGYLFNRFVKSSNYYTYEVKNILLTNPLVHKIFCKYIKRRK